MVKKWRWMTTGALIGSGLLALTFVGIESRSELNKLREENERIKEQLTQKNADLDLFPQKQSTRSFFGFGSPTQNDPFEDMRQRMDQFFGDSFFDHSFNDSWQASLPSVKVEDFSEKYLVVVEPFDPQRYEVETEIEGQYLRLNISTKNQTTEESQSDKGSYTHHFSGNSQITKRLYLQEPFDSQRMEISIDKNFLEIEIPKIS